MTVIKNNHTSPLGIAGVTIRPNGGTADVAKWESAKTSNAVKIWLARGVIEVVAENGSKATPPAMPAATPPAMPAAMPPATPAEGDEKEKIIAELQKLGIERTKRTGLEKLRAELAEATKVDA